MQKFWEPDRGGGLEEGGSNPPPFPDLSKSVIRGFNHVK